MRSGSAGEAAMWYTSQPAKKGPSTVQSRRAPSAVRTNAPLRVPTSARTPAMTDRLPHRRELIGGSRPSGLQRLPPAAVLAVPVHRRGQAGGELHAGGPAQL